MQRRGESGAAALETTLAVSGLLLLIALVIAGIMYAHAQQVASDAAQAAVIAVAEDGGSEAAGEDEAQRLLAELAPTLLARPEVVATRGTDEATVEIRASTVRVLGVSFSVHADASAPVERFRPVEP